MNESEKMDDLLARKLQSHRVDFEEAKWDQALKLIEADEQRKKRRWFFFISLGSLGLALAIATGLWLFSGTNKSAALAIPTTPPINNTPSGSPNPSVSTIQQSSAPPPAVSHPSSVISAADPAKGGVASPVSSVPVKESVPEKYFSANASDKAATSSSAVNKRNTSTGISAAITSSGNRSLSGSSADNNTGTNANTPTPPASTISKPAESTVNSVSDKHVSSVQQNDSPAPGSDSATTALSPADANKPTLTAIDSIKPSTMVKQDSSQKTVDSIATNHVVPPAEEQGGPAWNFYLGAGMNYLLGSNIQPLGGIFLTRSIAPKWEAGIGLQYTAIHGSTRNLQVITSDTFSFGVKSTSTQITAEKLHYLVLPVFARYQAFKQIHLILGANMYYLLTSTDNISTVQSSYTTTLTTNVHKDHGYTEGYQLYDIGLTAGVEWDFWKRFSCGAYFNYGLMNLINQSYFPNVPAFKNNSMQVLLRYQLFKH